MDEKMRTRIMIGLGVLALVFMVLWISSCGSVKKYNTFSKLEMEKRLDAEKSRDELLKVKAALEAKVQSLEKARAEEAVTLDTMKKSLTQLQMVNSSLQEERDKLNKAKQELEEQLKQAVYQGKISAPKTRK